MVTRKQTHTISSEIQCEALKCLIPWQKVTSDRVDYQPKQFIILTEKHAADNITNLLLSIPAQSRHIMSSVHGRRKIPNHRTSSLPSYPWLACGQIQRHNRASLYTWASTDTSSYHMLHHTRQSRSMQHRKSQIQTTSPTGQRLVGRILLSDFAQLLLYPFMLCIFCITVSNFLNVVLQQDSIQTNQYKDFLQSKSRRIESRADVPLNRAGFQPLPWYTNFIL